MNRVFKVVWSKTKGMFIVVSEIAGTWQKQTSKAVVSKKCLASLLCVVLAAGGVATSVAASDVATADHATTADTATKAEKMDYVNVKGTSSGNTAEDPGAKGSNSMAIGQDARADGPNGIAIGNGAVTASRGSDKSNNGTNSITIGTAKTTGSEVLTLGTIKYVNSLYGRVNADGTIDTTKDIATIGDPVPFQDKVILMGYDTTFDANNKDILKKDTDTFLRTSAIIGHENTIKTNSVAGFGWSYGESDMYIFGGRNTIDGEDSLILGRENDVKRTRNAGSGYVNITGDRNIIRNEGNGINISGSKNRINYYKEAVWYGGDAPNNNSAEKDFGNVSDPSLHIYGSRNTLGLDLDGRKVTSGFVVGENNRLYSYNGYVFGTYNNVYASGATVFGRGNLVGIDGNTPAKGTDFLALGLGNTIKSSYGMGVGASNTIESEYGMAFGRYNKVGSEASYSTVAGYQNYASKGNNVVFGLMNNNDKSSGFSKEDPSGVNSTAIGIMNKSKGERSTTLGINNTVKEDGKNASAFGSVNTASGEEALAVGRTNYATNKMAVAVGNWNNYTNISGEWKVYDSGKSSVALGVKNATPGDSANAIGGMNLAMGTSSTAVGYRNKANGQADVALGYGNIAGGDNVPSETYITAVGVNNQAFGKQNSVFGAYNQANVIRGVVAGFQNFGMGYGSIIVGNQNNYLFSDPFTISGITMTGNQQPASTGILSTTMGVANLMLADNGGTYGYGNQVTGSRSYAFGATNINTGIDSFIMGHDSTIAEAQLSHYQPNNPQNIRNAMVVGNHSLADLSDSVALGSWAITSRDSGMRGYDPTTGVAMTDETLFTGTMTKEAYNQAKTDLASLRTTWEGEVDKLHAIRLAIQSQQYSSPEELQTWLSQYAAQETVEMEARKAYFGKKVEMGKVAGVWEGQLAALSIGNEEEGLTRQITGVAAGTNDTDAVNVAQLKRVADMVDSIEIPTIPDIPNSIMYTATNPTNGNTDSGTAADGDHVSGDGTNTPDDNSVNNTVKKKSVTFTEGFNFTGGTNTTATVEENGVVTFDVKPTLTNMTSIAGNNGTITFGSNGISLGHGGTTIIVNSDGLNVGNKHITNVAAGRSNQPLDAVNMSQLSGRATTSLDSITDAGKLVVRNLAQEAIIVEGKNDVTVTPNVDKNTGKTTYTVDVTLPDVSTMGELTYKANGGKKDADKKKVGLIKGLDFTNGINTTATIEDNGIVTYHLNTTLTNMTSIAGNNGTLTFGSNGIKLGHGGTTIIVNSDGLNVGNTYITGVAPGRPGIEHTSDAVNMGQLSALQNQVADIDDKITNTKPIKLENGTNTAVASREENGQTIWKVNVDLDNYVTNDQLDNYVTNEKLENTYVDKEELDTTLSEYAKTDASNLEANDVTKWKEKLGITNIENGTATSISYQADGDTAAKSVTLKEGFTFKGDGNIIASTGDKGEVKYTLAKELTNMDSVGGHDGKLSFNETETTLSHGTGNEATAISVGKDIRFTNGATTVKVTENGLDAGGTRIANVADGVDMSDAATVGQLRQAQGSVVQQISQVEHHLTKEIADVGALSAAMSALKPLGYNPDEKTQIMAGIGGYKGSQGVALGVAHHDNEDVMYHGGLAYSGNGVMWNAGISIRLGEQGNRKGYFLRYAPEPVKAEMARLYDEIDHLRKANAKQMAMNETTDKKMMDYGSTLQAMQQSVNSLADENAALRKQNEELARKVEWLMARVSG